MKIALAQINPKVADFEGNARMIREAARRAKVMGADLAVFPEMSIMGYPPRDLVEQESLVQAGLHAMEQLAGEIELPSLVGFVSKNETGRGRPLHNSVALLCNGRIASVHHKTLLPTYDVFDEDRHFEPGRDPKVAMLDGRTYAVTICEDIWRNVGELTFRYPTDPLPLLVKQSAGAIINLSASPFTLGKTATRRKLLADLAKQFQLPLVYVSQVGGNDELIFDGGSMVVNAAGEVVAQAKRFEEDILVVDLDALPEPVTEAAPAEEKIAFCALALGTRDYLHKCGFKGAVIGLSGGIDSSVTAAVAVEALGPENVIGVAMPSRFSSAHSLEDAEALAKNLGIRFLKIPIEAAHAAFLEMLQPVFEGRESDTTEENIQARCRGVVLMALANKFHMITLATGNKSELATGYCTLYGDMCGGLAPIGDLPKGMVYRIARWVNRKREVIPTNILTKPPSAELRPNQTDQDTLPPYDLLDRILHECVEEQKGLEAIAASGIDRAAVSDTIRRIELAEYKRRQAVPGLKITSKAFGFGRRMPIARQCSPPED